jgi:hypothetical protein
MRSPPPLVSSLKDEGDLKNKLSEATKMVINLVSSPAKLDLVQIN